MRNWFAGRAADALIASYLRELVADDAPEPALAELQRDAETPASAQAAPADGVAADVAI